MLKRLLCLITWTLGCSLLLSSLAVPVAASGPVILAEPLLIALDRPTSIVLSAYAAYATLDCVAKDCTLSVRQTYWLHNKSPDQAVSLQIGLAADSTTLLAENTTLKQSDNPLSSTERNESYSAIWTLTLQPDQHQTLVLTYRHTAITGPLLAFACDLGRLVDSWGIPEGVRVMLTLPVPVNDDAILWMMPFNSQFDGRNITWDYEIPNELGNHQTVLVLPAAWQILSQARTENDHQQLAELYLVLEQAVLPLQLAERDYFGLAIAEYQAVIAAQPDDPSAYLQLALAYRARPVSQPAERLNYELLAAHELELAHKLAPENKQIADNLARSYYAAALISADQGNEVAALGYLDLMRSPGLPTIASDENLQNLALRWSITLAEKGAFQIAFEQGKELLPPTILQMLQDYAPPFTSIQTLVSTDPGMRLVTYQIDLYAPSALQTITRLRAIQESMNSIPGVEASSVESDLHIEMRVSIRYNAFIELKQRIAEIDGSFGEDKDLLSLALRAPWRSPPEQMGLYISRLRSSYFYREQIDGSAIQQAWLEQSQYAQWRIAEAAVLPAADELTQLQQRLANYMLRQQQQVWRQLPAYSLWNYKVHLDQDEASQGEWIITWGETRSLEINMTIYNTTMLRRLALISVAVLALVVLVLLIPWKYLRRTGR
ncbi:MAG: hypothetical protein ACYCZF_04005 [Anaerolineae bacterium]